MVAFHDYRVSYKIELDVCRHKVSFVCDAPNNPFVAKILIVFHCGYEQTVRYNLLLCDNHLLFAVDYKIPARIIGAFA